MSLPPSTRLGSYEILSLIGAGGMGEVYRAHDPRLGRDVAVKVLPPGLPHDADRLRRFEQEARAASRLNHPNIVVVHDVGTANGTSFLVTELLDGETLRERLKSGRIPAQVAIDFAVQIARGLQAAHDQGIVHRDLKPENLFVTRDGRVKILDFGLAKLRAPQALTDADETATDHRTQPGTVMGTAGYMSPEQIRGEEADLRADVFAFGAVLYELLTGTPAFGGATRMDVMSAVLRSDAPDATSADATVPPALSRIVRRCLQQQPSDRFQSLADLSFAIENLSATSAATSDLPRGGGRRANQGRLGWIVAAVLGAGLVAVGWFYTHQAPDANRLFVASIAPEGRSLFDSFVISPDGHSLAYASAEAGKTRLRIRSLDGLTVSTVAIPGTDGAAMPFWSPDSQSLGFFADNHLKVVGIHGGQPRSLTTTLDARGGAWGQDDVIVFGPDRAGPLYQVSAKSDGVRTQATVLDDARQQKSHRWPHFLPDGRHFFYFARSTDPNATGVYLGVIGATGTTFIVRSSSDAVFAAPGFMLFVRGESLIAQEFDSVGLTARGEPTSIVPKVGFTLSLNRGSFSASDTGVLVYGRSEESQAVWFDRAHKALGTVTQPASQANLYLSYDGRSVAVERPDAVTGANDLYVIEFDRGGIESRFTINPNSDSRAVWTRDDKHLVWGANRTGVYDIYTKALAGGDERPLLLTPKSKVPTDITPDGRFLFFESGEDNSRSSLQVLTLTGDARSFPLLGSGFNEAQARMSPDGRWISYTTDKDGTDEVYMIEAAAVLPQPGQSIVSRTGAAVGGRRVSPNGGAQAMWRTDGKELYYLSADRRLMSVPIAAAGPGVPLSLFEIGIIEAGRASQHYSVSPDGQRFLILTRVDDNPAATVITNWAEALRRPR